MFSKCCARCKTPYNCGNRMCSCHARAEDAFRAAWEKALLESDSATIQARFRMDGERGNRNPNVDDGGLHVPYGPRKKKGKKE